jgi:hypothetical protein
VPTDITITESEPTRPLPRGQHVRVSDPEPRSEGAVIGHEPRGQMGLAVPSDLSSTVRTIVNLQRERVFYIRAQQRLDRMTESFIAQRLGFQARNDAKWDDADKRSAKALFAEAKKIRVGVERGETRVVVPQGRSADVIADCSMPILTFAQARETIDEKRAEVEARMVALAKTLPVYPWVESVKGVTAKGLAIVVGEAGDLADYPKKGHLWKRLGLAVFDGQRQGSVPKGVTGDDRKEAWKARGYKPARRAETYAMFDDTMLRSQWRGEKDGVAARPLGPYGAYYAKKKAEYVAREKPYADRSARRAMTKMFIRDLWNARRAASCEVSKDQPMHAARYAAE